MGKLWSVLFASVPILGVLCFVYGGMAGIWLPRDVSLDGNQIDHLFYLVLVITGFVFVATQAALAWFTFKYDAAGKTTPATYLHGSRTLELVWTLIPAAVLVFIAFYQMQAWADTKIRVPDVPITAEITARQFEWRIRYPRTPELNEDGKPTGKMVYGSNDLYVVNDLRVPVNQQVLIDLKAMDVIHSFFLPNLRVKQDAVPGMKIPVWFTPTEEGDFDIVCAELCGWGHYKMKGRLRVMDQASWEEWIDTATEAQHSVDGKTPQVAAAEQQGATE